VGLGQATEFLSHGISKTGQHVPHMIGLTLANTHIQNTHMHTYIYTYTNTHTYTYTHTHIHTFIQVEGALSSVAKQPDI